MNKINKIFKNFWILSLVTIFFISWNIFAIKNDFEIKNYCESHNFCEKYLWNFLLWNEKISKNWDEKILPIEKAKKILEIIYKKWYESEKLDDKKKLSDNLAAWLVKTIWDPFSMYMPAVDSDDFHEEMAWNFEWIWAELQMKDWVVIITSPLKWSPAIKAWLMPQDIILKVNKKDILWQDLTNVVKKIRWKKWTEVVLNIFRPSESKTLDIKIIRNTIHINSVKYELKKSKKWTNVWYISINQFWDKTIKEFYNWLNQAEKDNVKYLVLDLRFNGWWYLDWAVWIASAFLDNWSLVTTIKSKSWNRELRTIPFWNKLDLPTAILINWGSASASEIVSWALRDNKKAILVWEKSFWKWSVQELIPFLDGSNLRITTAKWFTPNNQNIHQIWINPDVEVKRTYKDMLAKKDPQLDKAIEILEKWDLNQFYNKKTSLTWSVVISFNSSWVLITDLKKKENKEKIIEEIKEKIFSWTWKISWSWEKISK